KKIFSPPPTNNFTSPKQKQKIVLEKTPGDFSLSFDPNNFFLSLSKLSKFERF
ncbi:hypothetical protein GIB67_003119, partial [Kingdonia uniflora]